tara:strand:+ start:169 stop:840 length:672 start_codon:yes stop_codon:yes gene_type:complete
MSLQLDRQEQLGEDGKEGITYACKVKRQYKSECLGQSVHLKRGATVAVKTFRKTKSSAKMSKEASFQQKCAAVGVSPPVYAIDTGEKQIVMQMMASLPAEKYRNNPLPDNLQYQICALMDRMDQAGVLHNDGLARNVMQDESGRVYMIDFGFAKTIGAKVKKKFGNHPNVAVTLWALVRGFKRFGIKCSIMDNCVKAEEKQAFFDKGESLLVTETRARKRRKR